MGVKECFVGKTVTEIKKCGESIEIIFSDGAVLEIDANLDGNFGMEKAVISIDGYDVDGKFMCDTVDFD